MLTYESDYLPVNESTLKFFITPVQCYQSHANGHILLFVNGGTCNYWRIYYDGKEFYLCDFENYIEDEHVKEICSNFRIMFDPFHRNARLENAIENSLGTHSDLRGVENVS